MFCRNKSIETLLQSICFIYVDDKEKLDTYEEDIGKLGDAEQFARLELSRKRSIIGKAKLKIIVQDAKKKTHITTYDFSPNPVLMETLLTNVNSFGNLTEHVVDSDDASVDGSTSSTLQVFKTQIHFSTYFTLYKSQKIN